MTQFKYIPDYNALSQNNASYFETPEFNSSIRSALTLKHSDYKNKIQQLPLSFVQSFINSMSTLYTNKYIRANVIDQDKIDVVSLDEAIVYVERSLHLHRDSAIHVYTEDDTQKFEALDPTRFFHENQYTFISYKDGTTLLYIQLDGSVELYLVHKELSDAVEEYDIDKGVLDQYKQEDADINVYVEVVNQGENPPTLVPLVTINYYNIKVAQLNALVTLQKEYILGISWGLFVSGAKLISQVTLSSDMKSEDAQALFENFGSTQTIIKTDKGDKFEIFDTGSITVLTDMFKMYNEIISIKAIQSGADINAIMPQVEGANESGEAKQTKLDYINKARKNHVNTFKKFESDLWILLKDGFNIDTKYKGIQYQTLVINQTPEQVLAHNTKLYEIGLFNFIDLYANTFDMSYKDAKIKIAEKGLIDPSDIDIELPPVDDQIE